MNEDFGLVDETGKGIPIENKESILNEIDHSLGKGKPPTLEYFLVRPYCQVKIPFTDYGICWNTFGHAAVRYTLPNGEQYVMNIEGKKDKLNMVQFRKPKEFLYGTDRKLVGDQLGLYNRSIIGIRVENLPEEKILEMHKYFQDLQKEVDRGNKEFNIIPNPVRDIVRPWVPFRMIQYGNCAKWTSEGLLRAGVVTKSSYWPKSIWIHMFENHQKTSIDGLDNMSVVSYRRVQHACHQYGQNGYPINQVAPFQTPRTFAYFNLEKFANRIVEVPKGGMKAEIKAVDEPLKPSSWRNMLNSNWTIGATSVTGVILTSLLIGRRVGRIPRYNRYWGNRYWGKQTNLNNFCRNKKLNEKKKDQP